ncbi:hypothetical protein CHUAL_003615 [Chamberlinius hualienensis]
MDKKPLWKELEPIFSILSLYGLTTNNATTKFRSILKYIWLAHLWVISCAYSLNILVSHLNYYKIRLEEKRSGYEKTQQKINHLQINITGAVALMYVGIYHQTWNRIIHSLKRYHVGPITAKATRQSVKYICMCIVSMAVVICIGLLFDLSEEDDYLDYIDRFIAFLFFGLMIIFGILLCSIYYVVDSYIPLRITELLHEIESNNSPLRKHKMMKIVLEECERLNQLSTEFYQLLSPIIYFVRSISIVTLAFNIKQLQIKWEFLLCFSSCFRHLQLAFYLGFTISYFNLSSTENMSRIAKSIAQEMLNVRSSLTSSIYEPRLAWIRFNDLINFSHIRLKRTADRDTDIITLFTDVCDMINLVDSNY